MLLLDDEWQFARRADFGVGFHFKSKRAGIFRRKE
jgi:hypothetical protein